MNAKKEIIPPMPIKIPIKAGESWVVEGMAEVESSGVDCESKMEEVSVSGEVCGRKERVGGMVVRRVAKFGGGTLRVEPMVVDRLEIDDIEVLDDENGEVEVVVVVNTVKVDTATDSDVC
jgi:hypothetical protein